MLVDISDYQTYLVVFCFTEVSETSISNMFRVFPAVTQGNSIRTFVRSVIRLGELRGR